MENYYDKKLDDIIKKYEFVAPDIADSTLINSIVLNAITKRCAGKKVAIWGVGKKNAVNGHCAVIIKRYVLNLPGLQWLIDSDIDLQGNQFMGYPVISPEELVHKDVDIVIIASKGSRFSIRDNIKALKPDCEYFDIYEELEKEGLKIDYNFFSEQNIYTELYKTKSNYEQKENNEDALKKLISLYLKIRDFYYAEKYITEYCENQYKDWKFVKEMWKKIQQLINEVKEKNSGRKGDIIIHLIDSARAMDVYERSADGKVKLSLFKEYEKNAVIFSEAYSTGPSTYESMIGTIKQKYSYDENVYENNNFMFDIDEFAFLKRIKKQNMPIRFYNSKDYYIMNKSDDIYMKEQLHMPEKLWSAACDMAVTDGPVFNFLYYPWEIHFPMLCGYMRREPQIKMFADVGLEDMSDFIENQLQDCLKYVDCQFAYYKDFFSEDAMTVIMADHSQPIYDKKRNDPFFMFYNDKDRVVHVTFIIISKELKAGVNSQLFSMLDFNKVMEQAYFEKCIYIPEREIIEYQFYNVQNRRLRELAMKRGLMDYTEGIRCFVSKKYLYAKTATGKQEVYDLKDIFSDISSTDEGKKFIKYVEENYDTGFPNFWTVRNTVS